MIEETALVSQVDGSRVWIEVDRRSACAACASADGCGQKRINDWFPSKRVTVEVDNPNSLIVSPGQTVTVGLEEGALVKASLILYLLPLLGLILSPILISIFGFSEIFQILGAILGFTVGLLFTRALGRKGVAAGDLRPQLLH